MKSDFLEPVAGPLSLLWNSWTIFFLTVRDPLEETDCYLKFSRCFKTCTFCAVRSGSSHFVTTIWALDLNTDRYYKKRYISKSIPSDSLKPISHVCQVFIMKSKLDDEFQSPITARWSCRTYQRGFSEDCEEYCDWKSGPLWILITEWARLALTAQMSDAKMKMHFVLLMILKEKITPKWTFSHFQAVQSVDEFDSSSEHLEKCSITPLAHQWILCSEWVPSEKKKSQ